VLKYAGCEVCEFCDIRLFGRDVKVAALVAVRTCKNVARRLPNDSDNSEVMSASRIGLGSHPGVVPPLL